MNHSVVGRCIINPYLDNKNLIYKPSNAEIGRFDECEGDECRRQCAALRTHKRPERSLQREVSQSEKIVKQTQSHDILNTAQCACHECNSTTRISLNESVSKITPESYQPVNANRLRERERVQRKMALYYGKSAAE